MSLKGREVVPVATGEIDLSDLAGALLFSATAPSMARVVAIRVDTVGVE